MRDVPAPSLAQPWGGLRGTRERDVLLEEIRSWAQRHDLISGLAVYGSAARGEADPYSDLDLAVVVRVPEDCTAVERQLIALRDCVLDFRKDGKRVMFLRDPFIKVEFSVVPEDRLSELRRLFQEPPIADPSRAVLVDKSGALTAALVTWSQDSATSIADAFEREAISFLYYYHGFHASFARRDQYKAFFLQCLAFFKLATLFYISRGGRDHLYAPRFLSQPLGREDWSHFKELSPILDPFKMRERTEKMFDLFVEIVRQTGRIDLFPLNVLSDFRSHIVSCHPRFRGLRDLGMIEGVRPGVVFRSAELDRYPDEEVKEWIDSVGLRTLIDLRTDQEIAEPGYGYAASVLEKVSYLRAPITTRPAKVSHPNSDVPLSGRPRFYADLLCEGTFKEAIGRIVEVLTDASRSPVVIHCRGGTDRTGVVVAVLLLALEVDRRTILGDYLLSYGSTKPEYLERCYQTVEREGGVEAYLERIGVTPERLRALRANLREPVARERRQTEGDM